MLSSCSKYRITLRAQHAKLVMRNATMYIQYILEKKEMAEGVCMYGNIFKRVADERCRSAAKCMVFKCVLVQ